MRRRTLLASVGATLSAGCLSGLDAESGTPPADGRTSGTSRATGTRDTVGTDETIGRQTTTATEPPHVSVPDENACPDFGDTPVVCFENAGPGYPVLLYPSDSGKSNSPIPTGSLPNASLSFTLSNGTDEPHATEATFTTNYYAWSLEKRVEGEWFHVEPRVVPEPAMQLDPGDSHAWQLTVDNTNLGEPLPRAEGTESVAVPGLGPGTYAFGIDGWFEGTGYQNGVALAARFELSGDPIDLTPTDDLRVVSRDDDQKRVESSDPQRTYRATRVEGESEPRRMILEQVIRDAPLRNLLASFEDGVRVVELAGRDAFGPYYTEPQVVAYDGATYRVEATEE